MGQQGISSKLHQKLSQIRNPMAVAMGATSAQSGRHADVQFPLWKHTMKAHRLFDLELDNIRLMYHVCILVERHTYLPSFKCSMVCTVSFNFNHWSKVPGPFWMMDYQQPAL